MTQQASARQAITTKFIPPTNCKGARIKASCEAGSIVIPYPDELDQFPAHKAACVTLQAKIAERQDREYGPGAGKSWRKPMIGGAAQCNPKGYVWVFAEV